MGYIYNSTIERRTRLKSKTTLRRGGKLKRSAMRRGKPMKKKREPLALTRAKHIARERDNYRCQYPGCDVYSKHIDVHHKSKRSQRPDLKFDPNHMICLCRRHHAWTDHNRQKAIEMGLLETETYEKAQKELKAA